MNDLRIQSENTVEARLAAVIKPFVDRFAGLWHRLPDYADYRDELRKHVHREMLICRLDALGIVGPERDRMRREIVRELAELEL